MPFSIGIGMGLTSAGKGGLAAAPVLRYGVAMSMMEGSSDTLPGTLYGEVFPTEATHYAYHAAKGLDHVRVEALWERLQPTLFGSLGEKLFDSYGGAGDPDPLRNPVNFITLALDRAQAAGLKVVLDLCHNYGRRYIGYTGGSWASKTKYELGSTQVPVTAFVDYTVKCVQQFGSHPAVAAIELMNEPHDQAFLTEAQHVSTWQAAINGIRAVNQSIGIWVNGFDWSSANYWETRNATLHTLTDPSNRITFSAHQYNDDNETGTYTAGTEATVRSGAANRYAQRIGSFLTWLGTYSKKGNIGEAGVPNTWDHAEAFRQMLTTAAAAGVSVTGHLDVPYLNDAYVMNLFPPAGQTDRYVELLLESAAKGTSYVNTPIVDPFGAAAAATVQHDSYTNSHSMPVTIPAGANRVLVLAVTSRDLAIVTGVTYGGVAMTQQATHNNAGACGTAIYTLTNPTVGTANAVVAMSDFRQASLVALPCNGVHQTTPIDSFTSGGNFGTTVAGGVTITTTTANPLVLALGNTEASGLTATPAGGQTDLVNADHPDSAQGHVLFASKAGPTTPGAVTATWTIGTAGSWSSSFIALRRA